MKLHYRIYKIKLDENFIDIKEICDDHKQK